LVGVWQQTETHWVVPLLVTTTVAVLVSVTPEPTSVPAAAAPPFWVTPSQGSAPISNEALAGVATIVAVLPGATEAVSGVMVEAVAPLMLTEHQFKKFATVSVTFPPPSAVPASLAPPSPASAVLASVPLELPEDDPLDPPEEDPPELLPDPLPELLPLELLPPASSAGSGGDELLLHATALAAASAPRAAIPNHPSLFDVLFMAKPLFFPGTRTPLSESQATTRAGPGPLTARHAPKP
jgi:hypothetical protein